MSLDRRQVIEFFHVAFLDILTRRMEPTRYVLKGGVNLRYFFGSLRYSEDIDLDLCPPAPWGLEKTIDGVLTSPTLRALLRVGGLEVGEFSKPKQTATTRRWKIAIISPDHPRPVRTKIEFSNRNGDPRYRLDALPAEVVAPYAMRPPRIQHYVDGAPAEQKVKALAGRSETQARDVFDLDLLLRRQALDPGSLGPALRRKAADIALAMPFAAYRDQVLPFLDSEGFELYGSEDAWEQMQTFVAEQLEQGE